MARRCKLLTPDIKAQCRRALLAKYAKKYYWHTNASLLAQETVSASASPGLHFYLKRHSPDPRRPRRDDRPGAAAAHGAHGALSHGRASSQTPAEHGGGAVSSAPAARRTRSAPAPATPSRTSRRRNVDVNHAAAARGVDANGDPFIRYLRNKVRMTKISNRTLAGSHPLGNEAVESRLQRRTANAPSREPGASIQQRFSRKEPRMHAPHASAGVHSRVVVRVRLAASVGNGGSGGSGGSGALFGRAHARSPRLCRESLPGHAHGPRDAARHRTTVRCRRAVLRSALAFAPRVCVVFPPVPAPLHVPIHVAPASLLGRLAPLSLCLPFQSPPLPPVRSQRTSSSAPPLLPRVPISVPRPSSSLPRRHLLPRPLPIPSLAPLLPIVLFPVHHSPRPLASPLYAVSSPLSSPPPPLLRRRSASAGNMEFECITKAAVYRKGII
ncbi:hypothetical protein B0H17DRAFT_1146335 [Mycena rosella]|uniref:Uncharacterized protein n=1 Tax=Mycena rosella TaxID=1033263 RepID=A0AAD7CP41_MYCRO|nr:hypothetical protein B0H17DRAFT_1146335 [Mycena rosella]